MLMATVSNVYPLQEGSILIQCSASRLASLLLYTIVSIIHQSSTTTNIVGIHKGAGKHVWEVDPANILALYKVRRQHLSRTTQC